MSKTPAFGSPAALAHVEKVREERAFLAELHSEGLFDEVALNKVELAEDTTLQLRYFLKVRRVEAKEGHYQTWLDGRFALPSEFYKSTLMTCHPVYWYVKALIKEKQLKELGVPLQELPDEMYYPTHDWLLFKGRYGPQWARSLPEGDYAPEDEVENE